MSGKKVGSLLLTILMSACGGQGNNSNGLAPQVIQGQIRLAGSEPAVMVMLRPESGGSEVRLTGVHLDELRRLGGVVISVTGQMGSSDMMGFDVTDYEIMSVQGRRPSVGTLVERDGSLWLDGETSVRLDNVPDAMRGYVGAKLWIVGRLDDGVLRPETYGVIREPQ